MICEGFMESTNYVVLGFRKGKSGWIEVVGKHDVVVAGFRTKEELVKYLKDLTKVAEEWREIK